MTIGKKTKQNKKLNKNMTQRHQKKETK